MSNYPIPGLVVTGTDTGIGKTVVMTALIKALLHLGKKVLAIKLIQTGVARHELATSSESDAYVYQSACTNEHDKECLTTAVLFSFTYAAAPSLAARLEGKVLSSTKILDALYKVLAETHADLFLCETAGGLHVPINDSEDMCDLLTRLHLPLLLVSPNRLGTINHTILSLERISASALPLLGLVLTPMTNDPLLGCDNVETLKKSKALQLFAKNDPLLLELPHADFSAESWVKLGNSLTPLAEAFLAPKKPLDADELLSFDAKHIWHPYSRTPSSAPLYPVVDAYRNKLVLANGQELLDGMSSWWSAIHGYKHPHLLNAVHRQAESLAHVMFGGLTHSAAVRLVQRILPHLPKDLSTIFFADSGSVACEVAMKMALQYHVGRGEKERTRFLTPLGGYHGDTLGCMSVCDPVNGMHSLFEKVLPKHLFLPRPAPAFSAPFDCSCLTQAKELLAQKGHTIAALILEPIVQGAGGMWFYHREYLNELVSLCRDYGLLVIFDEIATGFGHTGRFLATEWTTVTPDILCLGKALTGGLMTLALTACSEKVAEGICRNNQVFMHGPTFMANALACAVAEASLDLMEEGNWKTQVATIEEIMRQELAPCRENPLVKDVRVLGDIGVVETKEPVDAAFLTRYGVDHGIWLRPFNNLVYLMPPYVTPKEDLYTLCRTLKEALFALAQKTA